MKKIICLLLVLSMVLSMAGCKVYIDEEALMDAIGQEIKDQVHQAGEDIKQEAEDALNDAVQSGKDAVQDAVDGALDAGQDALDSATLPTGGSGPLIDTGLPEEEPEIPMQDSQSGVPDAMVSPGKPDNFVAAWNKFWEDLGKSTEQKCREAGHPAYRVNRKTGSVTCKCGRKDYDNAEEMLDFFQYCDLIFTLRNKMDYVPQFYFKYLALCYDLNEDSIFLLCLIVDDGSNMEAQTLVKNILSCGKMVDLMCEVEESSWALYSNQKTTVKNDSGSTIVDLPHFSEMEQNLSKLGSTAYKLKNAAALIKDMDDFNDNFMNDQTDFGGHKTFHSLIGGLTKATSYLPIPMAGNYFKQMLTTVGNGLDTLGQLVAEKNLRTLCYGVELAKAQKNIRTCEKPIQDFYSIFYGSIYSIDPTKGKLDEKYIIILSGNNWEHGPSLEEIANANLTPEQYMLLAPYIDYRMEEDLGPLLTK